MGKFLYKLSRPILTAAVVLFAYCLLVAAALGFLQFPPENRGPAVLAVFVLLAIISRKIKGRKRLTAMGTAAWENIRGLMRAGMLGGRQGLILGRIPEDGKPRVAGAVKTLFNPSVGSPEACRELLDSINRKKRKQGRLVRLPQAVHTAVFAPTGAGKGVSLILPFLLTCEDSCVVVDFKGENALLTAEHRARMGHRIVILDPFKVVTQ